MPIDRTHSQFRIRVKRPKSFKPETFKTLDVGAPGGLQFVRAIPEYKSSNKPSNLSTQSVHVSTKDFRLSKGKLEPKTPRGEKELSSLLRTQSTYVKEHFRKGREVRAHPRRRRSR